ncbi:hypothetical protein [Salinactinospora qingdaonensis]|uniref:Deacetylase sirtuin-type domain-containing protein n=1 Tax=Salinactinospora qingdaonensis TaxID=702744 RepID=A0ABP7G4X0_9ACTN
MRFPYHVLELDPSGLSQWATHFASGPDRRRDIEEGIWRRTQDQRNAEQSGWSEEASARRRIVHYWYRYDVIGTSLCMVDFYLYYCVTYPATEIDAYHEQVSYWLGAGGWASDKDGTWRRGDLRIRLHRFDIHPQDTAAGRNIPADYASLQVTITSDGCDPGADVVARPWQVLADGIRIKDLPGAPILIDSLAPLAAHVPFQVEVGCGTSVEAGIPPLHRLHEIYRVTTRHDNKPGAAPFILNVDDDRLLEEVLVAPENKFTEFCEMYQACFQAKPPPALDALGWLARNGFIVGPIITNNFDVLTARAGLTECFVRRYDQKIPHVPLLPETKALLVVGNHADRRRVEARAREAGMKVFFLDPEGFWDADGTFAPYPLEGAQDGDYVCHKTASEGLPEFVALLQGAQTTPSERGARAA